MGQISGNRSIKLYLLLLRVSTGIANFYLFRIIPTKMRLMASNISPKLLAQEPDAHSNSSLFYIIVCIFQARLQLRKLSTL